MCFDDDSRPPIPPIAGGALDSGPLTLTSADGVRFRAFAAASAQPTNASILILPDTRGLHPFFEELAMRFAEHGVDALAIDYFGRTAGTRPREADFDHQPHVAQLTWPGLEADIRAGASHLRTAEDGHHHALFVTGFCMGGRLAAVSATLGLGLSGVIPFYGFPTGGAGNGSPAPADLARKIECDVLAIYGGADQAVGLDAPAAFDRALEAAGVKHRTIVYPGAPHSFFDNKADEFADASAAAWAETLAFIGERAPGRTIA